MGGENTVSEITFWQVRVGLFVALTMCPKILGAWSWRNGAVFKDIQDLQVEYTILILWVLKNVIN